MEPDRYWFLYFGLLFLFLGSEIGQEICSRVFFLLCTCFFWVLAMIFAAAALFLRGVNMILFWLFPRRTEPQKAKAEE